MHVNEILINKAVLIANFSHIVDKNQSFTQISCPKGKGCVFLCVHSMSREHLAPSFKFGIPSAGIDSDYVEQT